MSNIKKNIGVCLVISSLPLLLRRRRNDQLFDPRLASRVHDFHHGAVRHILVRIQREALLRHLRQGGLQSLRQVVQCDWVFIQAHGAVLGKIKDVGFDL